MSPIPNPTTRIHSLSAVFKGGVKYGHTEVKKGTKARAPPISILTVVPPQNRHYGRAAGAVSAPRLPLRLTLAGPHRTRLAHAVSVPHAASHLAQVIIEHTSSNPNAPLHIGNLRNVMIGAHLAELMKAVGYEVQQAFYVNDLGAQIGLTALAYSRCYGLLKPSMKIDHWIGSMYAVMNTSQELQKVGIDVGELEDAAREGKEAVARVQAKAEAAAGADAKRVEGVREYVDIFTDLRGRYGPMFEVMMPVIRTIKDIKLEAGQLNLRYERRARGRERGGAETVQTAPRSRRARCGCRASSAWITRMPALPLTIWRSAPRRHLFCPLTLSPSRPCVLSLLGSVFVFFLFRQEPEAIRIFRKMVTDCLSGVQETLNTYNVRHDCFDFESELGWEGSNDTVLAIMRNSDYFVAPTQSNAQGVPQGGYLDMTEFIADQGFKTGRGGYQKEYPPLYVLRPDGSTLYTYRDVVYSLKKAARADLVLNIICSEQDLAQQKVALALAMLNPGLAGRQYHVSYDLVRLTSGRMSGRRGRYLLADDLYDELKDVIRETMREKYLQKGEAPSGAFFDKVTHEVSTAAMKYALLSVSCQTQISFDVKKVTSFEDASAPFILYNSARVTSLMSKFEGRVAAGELPPLPDFDAIDLECLSDPREWEARACSRAACTRNASSSRGGVMHPLSVRTPPCRVSSDANYLLPARRRLLAHTARHSHRSHNLRPLPLSPTRKRTAPRPRPPPPPSADADGVRSALRIAHQAGRASDAARRARSPGLQDALRVRVPQLLRAGSVGVLRAQRCVGFAPSLARAAGAPALSEEAFPVPRAACLSLLVVRMQFYVFHVSIERRRAHPSRERRDHRKHHAGHSRRDARAHLPV